MRIESGKAPCGASNRNALVSRDKVDRVLAQAESFVTERTLTLQQGNLLRAALSELRKASRRQDGPVPFVHLPLLVYSGLRGDYGAAISLSVATTLLYAGIDLLDDLADGDLPSCWDGVPLTEVNLAAATLLSALPQLAIAELDADPACIAGMQRTLALGLLRMSAGQQSDLAMTASQSAGVEEVEASVAAKSGEELAMFASLAGLLAGAAVDSLDAYCRLGRAIGTAGQLASDCYDLFTSPRSKDLKKGTRTLPIAISLGRLAGDEREDFLRLLDEAKRDSGAQEVVRRRLRSDGTLRQCAFIVEVYCQRALTALGDASPMEPAAAALREMINGISFYPKETYS